jgi:hypothetical protein
VWATEQSGGKPNVALIGIPNSDDYFVLTDEIYWLRRKKPYGSTFSSVPLEKTLDGPVTGRGANTGISGEVVVNHALMEI